MKPENLYHSGIVVDDLDATLDWFTKVADYRWTDVVEVDQVAQTPDQRREDGAGNEEHADHGGRAHRRDRKVALNRRDRRYDEALRQAVR